MNAGDIMTREVITIGPDSSILEAARLMMQHRISGLPVVDSSKNLVGVITEGDFLRRRETGTQHRRPRWLEFIVGPGKMATEYTHESGRKVSEIMTGSARAVTEDAPLDQIVAVMERNRIKRVPVVRGRELVGIVTRANLMRAVVRLAHETQPVSASDADIRKRIVEELNKLPWAPSVSVAVKDGIVKLSGVLLDERQRAALRIAAENVPGVKDVLDDLVWIDPYSGMILDGR
jgi:CBS domain-containing protein